MNINSVRYKFDELKELLDDKIVNLLVVAETKLDSTFNDNVFKVEGHKLLRRDQDDRGGGIMTLINSLTSHLVEELTRNLIFWKIYV